MKKYEGLFILQNTAKEEAIKELIDKLSSEISTAGGKIETVQKMDKRAFARVADKKFSTGYYVNFIFEIEPSAVHTLRGRLVQNPDVFRVLLTEGAITLPPAAAIP